MTDAEVIELIREIARLKNEISNQSKIIHYLEVKIRILRHPKRRKQYGV